MKKPGVASRVCHPGGLFLLACTACLLLGFLTGASCLVKTTTHNAAAALLLRDSILSPSEAAHCEVVAAVGLCICPLAVGWSFTDRPRQQKSVTFCRFSHHAGKLYVEKQLGVQGRDGYGPGRSKPAPILSIAPGPRPAPICLNTCLKVGPWHPCLHL